MRDVQDQLIAALFARAGGHAALVCRRAVPWRSMLFDGTRHVIDLMLDEAAAARLCGGIGEADFALSRHFVTDIVAEAVSGRVRVEALTIAEVA